MSTFMIHSTEPHVSEFVVNTGDYVWRVVRIMTGRYIYKYDSDGNEISKNCEWQIEIYIEDRIIHEFFMEGIGKIPPTIVEIMTQFMAEMARVSMCVCRYALTAGQS